MARKRLDRAATRRLSGAVDRLVVNQKFLDGLLAVAENDKARAELMSNPRAYLQGKGVGIPAEVAVHPIEGHPWGFKLGFPEDGGVRQQLEVRSAPKGSAITPKERARFEGLAKQARRVIDSDVFLDALDEVANDEQARAKFEANPKAYLHGKGLPQIPDEIEITVKDGSWCFVACWCCWCCCWCWWVCY